MKKIFSVSLCLCGELTVCVPNSSTHERCERFEKS
jgi:hypothetical protein